MAQFDTILIFPILWSLLLALTLNYFLVIKTILPQFSGLVKFRTKLKKISKPHILKLKTITVFI